MGVDHNRRLVVAVGSPYLNRGVVRIKTGKRSVQNKKPRVPTALSVGIVFRPPGLASRAMAALVG